MREAGDLLGRAVLELVTDDTKLNQGMDAAEKKTQSFGDHLGSVAKFGAIGLATIGTAALATVGSLTALTESVVGDAAEVRKLQRELGLTAEEASKLRFEGQRMGLSVDDLSKSFGLFSKNVENGTKAITDNHVEVVKTRDGHVDFEATLGKLADRFAAMPDGVEKTSLSLELFGRSGKDLLPLLNQGSAGLKGMGEEAERMGLVFDQKAVDAAKRLALAQKDLGENVEGLKNRIGIAFMPILADWTSALLGAANVVLPVVGSALQNVSQFVGDLASMLKIVATPAIELLKQTFAIASTAMATDAGTTRDAVADAFVSVFGRTAPDAVVGFVTSAVRQLARLPAFVGSVVGSIGEIFDVLTGRRPEAGGVLGQLIGGDQAGAVMGSVAAVRTALMSAFDAIGPVVQLVIDKVAELKGKFDELPPSIQLFAESFAGAALAAQATGLDQIIGNIGSALQGVVATLEFLRLTSVVGAVAEFIQLAATFGIVEAAGAVLIPELVAVGVALWAALGPAIVVGVIIAGLVLLVTHFSEVSESVGYLGGIIGTVGAFVIRRIGDMFSFIGTQISNFFAPFGQLLNLFSVDFPFALGVAAGAVFEAAGQMWSTLTGFVSDAFGAALQLQDEVTGALGELARLGIMKIGELVTGMWDALVEFVTVDVPSFLGQLIGSLTSGMANAAWEAVQGFIGGLFGAIPGLISAAFQFASRFLAGVQDALGIHSPSEVFAGVGVDVMRGLAMGISRGASLPSDQLRSVALDVPSTVVSNRVFASDGGAAGGDHGHPIYMDGDRVATLIGRRYVRGAALAGGPIG